MKEIHAQDGDERLQWMAETRMDSHDVIHQWQQKKGPGKESGGGDMPLQRKGEPQKPNDTGELKVQHAAVFVGCALVKRMGHAEPEEVNTPKAKIGEVPGVFVDIRFSQLAAPLRIGQFAH